MKLKKQLCCLLLVFLAALAVPIRAHAISDKEVKASSAVLMEAGSGKVLYEKNAHEKRPCASITKVMTLLLVMEALDQGKIALTDMVTASAHAASMGGSDIWLKEGETMSVDDMLKATVIMSANDAAVALAELVAGTEDDFVNRMNRKAKALGMADTVFRNCNGLDEDGHLTSAYDVALMSRELMTHKKIFDYAQTWIDYVRNGQTQLVNTNKLLKTYQGITGLKTGTTGKAGSCISATAERGGMSLISVVLGCASTADRFSSASMLLDYGFANWETVVPALPELSPIPLEGGMKNTVKTQAKAGGSILVPKGKKAEITTSTTLKENLTAPVEKGQIVGKISYRLGGEVLREVDLCAAENVERMTFSSVFALLGEAFLRV